MRCLILSKLLILITLIIFNQVVLLNCKIFTGVKTIFIQDKVYCLDGISFFYVDLSGISLDNDELVEESKWVDLANIKPRPDNIGFDDPIPSANKILFLDDFAGNFYVNEFDTTLKKWNINQPVKNLQPTKDISISLSKRWIFDEKTGKSYLTPDYFDNNVVIYDTINMAVNYSALTPINFSPSQSKTLLSSYRKYVQVLVPNGQILFIGGQIDNVNQVMNNLLIYDTINDTWQLGVF
jgi:hypothetical protein